MNPPPEVTPEVARKFLWRVLGVFRGVARRSVLAAYWSVIHP